MHRVDVESDRSYLHSKNEYPQCNTAKLNGAANVVDDGALVLFVGGKVEVFF